MKQRMTKLLEWGIYLWIFLLPWQTRWIIQEGMLNGKPWEYGTVSLYVVDVLLVLLIAIRFFAKGNEDNIKTIHGHKLNILPFALGILILSFLSIYWARDAYVSLYGVVRVAEGVLLYWLISTSRFSLTKAGIAFGASAVLQSVIGILQFTFQKTISSKWLGMALQESSVSGTSVVETATNRFLRAYGSLPHPNILAGFLVIGFIILLGLYLEKKSALKNILPGMFALVSAGLFVTYSRSGWLALLLAVIFFSIVAFRKSKRWRITIAKAAGIIVVVFLTFLLIYPETVSTRVASSSRLEQKSFSDRATYFQQSKELLDENWLHGVGINNYTFAVKETVDSTLPGPEYQPVHNVYVLSFVELGLFGLIVFLALIVQIARNSWLELKKHTVNHWVVVYSAIFGAMVIIFFFDHYFWTLSVGIMLFWLMLGLWQKAIEES
ncbi:O-antigen ligase family protein [Patescibacteria group bacterium]|nr:O-antigen ligase family protein [Patescibacteria group bacterium]